MGEITGPKIVAHGRPRAIRVHILCAATLQHIVVMHGAEIQAVARDFCGVRYRLVQLGAGKNDDTTGWRQKPHTDMLELLLWLWLFTRITFDVL
jgi:hypothetical protein